MQIVLWLQSRLAKQAFQEEHKIIKFTKDIMPEKSQSRLEKQAFQLKPMNDILTEDTNWYVSQSRLEKQAFQQCGHQSYNWRLVIEGKSYH